MSKVLQRGTAMLAVLMASVVFVTTALAQMPTSPWKKGAPFPEPDEELYGVTVNGKLYVFGGWDGGKARGVAYEYDPATDKWTKKTSMPRPAHHAALAAANGKIYVMGGFVPPKDTAIPVGGAWEPIDNAWEYDPAADSWKSLPPLPAKRGSAVAAEVGGKIYVIGGATTMEGAKDPFFTFFGPSRVLGTNEVYDPATNKWESRRPMSVPRNHAFSGVVNGKIYVIGGRTGHGFILSATNTDVVEEYNPINDSWSVPKERMPTARSGGASGSDGRRIYLAGGEVTTKDLVGAFKSVEAYDPLTNSWMTLPSMPMPRHGIAGAVINNRFHLVSGMMQSAGALTFLDPTLSTHTALHDILELQFGAPPPTAAGKSAAATPSHGSRNGCERNHGRLPAVDDGCKDHGGSAFPGCEQGLHALQRQQPARPGDAREVRPGDRDHARAPGTRPAFMEVVVEYPLGQGIPGGPLGPVQEKESGSDRITSAGIPSGRRGGVERLPGPPLQPLQP